MRTPKNRHFELANRTFGIDKPISIDGDEEAAHLAEGRPPAIRAGVGEPCPPRRGRAPSLVGAPAREALGSRIPRVSMAHP